MKCFPFREDVFQSKKFFHHNAVLESTLKADFEGENIEH